MMSIRSNDGMELPLLSDRDYRTVFEASPDAMLVVDSDGVIRDLNPQALSMFGWSREEMEGSGVERLVPAASRSRHERHRLRYAEAPRPRPMGQGLELQAVRKDGTTFPVEISLSPGKLASGLEHVICTIRDITSWKRMRWLSRMKLTAARERAKAPFPRAARRVPPVPRGVQDQGEAPGGRDGSEGERTCVGGDRRPDSQRDPGGEADDSGAKVPETRTAGDCFRARHPVSRYPEGARSHDSRQPQPRLGG